MLILNNRERTENLKGKITERAKKFKDALLTDVIEPRAGHILDDEITAKKDEYKLRKNHNPVIFNKKVSRQCTLKAQANKLKYHPEEKVEHARTAPEEYRLRFKKAGEGSFVLDTTIVIDCNCKRL